ncbi:MAG: hypothetical protein Kow0029_16670 [Candidatus Rifleibacteriota bacterium]
MNWLDRLERKYPQIALEGLIRYISFLMLTVFFLNQTNLLPYSMLRLDAEAIKAGQFWRLFTFLLIPISRNFLFLIFELSILVLCADALEAEWGTFKLTIYYFTGALANIIVAFFLPGTQFGSYFLYLTLFLGFATLHPDYEFLLFFILPVKVKYLALLSGLWIFINLAISPFAIKIAVILSIANYLIFFGPEFLKTMKGNYIAHNRRKEFENQLKQPEGARHTCKVCGRTEISDPELQFRYCTCDKCGENGVAFCIDHLAEHKKENQH